MSSARTLALDAVTTQGALLPLDFLRRLMGTKDAALPGLEPDAYQLVGQNLEEGAADAWRRLRAQWQRFQRDLGKAPARTRAQVVRQRWLDPLFLTLGYQNERAALTEPLTAEGVDRVWGISHRAWHSPIHVVGWQVPLETRTPGERGAAAQAPHALLQSYLNHAPDDRWGLLTNGAELRVLRQHRNLSQQPYLGFDLQAIFEGNLYPEFRLLWLTAHASRLVPRDAAGRLEAEGAEGPVSPAHCYLEQWRAVAEKAGVQALDDLRQGVELAIAALGDGFLRDAALKTKLHTGALHKQDYFRQLLRLAYRLIFIFVAEDRDLLLQPRPEPFHADDPSHRALDAARRRYTVHYATAHLRALALRQRGDRHADRWHALSGVLTALREGAPRLALPALGGFLFSPRATPDLDAARLPNRALLEAVRQLSSVARDGRRFPIDFARLGSRELGSVYEGLLELVPEITDAGFTLGSVAGNERKTTGSYYTPDALVERLLDSALDPLLAERDDEAALLDLKVCDPACGSGHFLVAAGRRIARRLAQIRTGDDEPAPSVRQHALRDVVSRCLYGVDLNEMAVELCRVSLWMESLEAGKPLTFLEGHVRHGNALLGATPQGLAGGIPDAAFKALTGDDKAVVTALKKRNKKEHKGEQLNMFLGGALPHDGVGKLRAELAAIEGASDADLAAVEAKRRAYRGWRASEAVVHARQVADLWCAAFVWPKNAAAINAGQQVPTQHMFETLEGDPQALDLWTTDALRGVVAQYRFFHWHLEFPQVFSETRGAEDPTTGWPGGFDAVLGNPPWERIKIQEKEFFAGKHAAIMGARNAAARRKLIAKLPETDPGLWSAWCAAKRTAEGESRLVRDTERYPLCGRGDVNTYSVFAELNRHLVAARGMLGCIVPAGIAMDATTQFFFRDLVERQVLEGLFHFENEEHIFEGVHHAFRFCLLTVGGLSRRFDEARFVAYARQAHHLDDPNRQYTLSAHDFALINPNTKTMPAFCWRRDAEITKGIYRRLPVLWADEGEDANPWGVRFKRMFDMANDSGLFHTRDTLLAQGCAAEGNHFVAPNGTRYLPLYEAKMIHQFDHRFGTYEGQTQAQANQGKLPEFDDAAHGDPARLPWARYWVAESDIISNLDGSKPAFCWRDITGSEKTRTVIVAPTPPCAYNHKTPLGFLERASASLMIAVLNSTVFDYCCRQKMGGTSLTYFLLKQVAVLGPSDVESHREFTHKRALELTYTAWDLEPFARDLGDTLPPCRWDPERRFLLRCELDAAFFHLYGLSRDDTAYVMDTFPIVRRKDEAEHGEYRTKRVILEIYDAMAAAQRAGRPYQTRLDPPPADPAVRHPPRADVLDLG